MATIYSAEGMARKDAAGRVVFRDTIRSSVDSEN